jgi:hypothetical protein
VRILPRKYTFIAALIVLPTDASRKKKPSKLAAKCYVSMQKPRLIVAGARNATNTDPKFPQFSQVLNQPPAPSASFP